jgi:hypothetical protein
VEEIEQYLVDILQRKSMAHVLQDLQCTKCKAVRNCRVLIGLNTGFCQQSYPLALRSVFYPGAINNENSLP